MRELLRRRGFRRLLTGQAVSSLGDWMGTLALMYFVLELSGSTTAVGGVLALRLLPMAVGAPLAARTVTRWSRRHVMLASDLIRAGMAVLLPLVPWLGWVYFWAFSIEVVALAFLPARDASIPALAGRDGGEEARRSRLSLANGLVMGGYYGMIPLGAGALGLVLVACEHLGLGGHWRYVVVFWADAATYLFSYAAVRSIAGLDRETAERPDGEAGGGEAHWDTGAPAGHGSGNGAGTTGAAGNGADATGGAGNGADATGDAGIAAAFRIPVLRAVLPGLVVVALGLGALFSLGVVFVRDVLGAGPVQFGALVALFGVGAATGLAVVRRLPEGTLIVRVRLGAAVQGTVISGMGLLATIPLAFLGAVIFGTAATVALVSAVTYLQESLAGVRRDLALTAFHAVLRFGLALAALVAGAAADAVGTVGLGPLGQVAPARLVLIVSGLVVAAGGLFVRPAAPEPAGRAGAGRPRRRPGARR